MKMANVDIHSDGNSPYSGLPEASFWKLGVGESTPETIVGLYKKKFEITPTMRIATAGSCFAQHITRFLRSSQFTFVDAEPAPKGISDSLARLYGYNLYSARYGNIYTSRQLLQLIREALGRFKPQNWIWRKGDRYYDGLRPSVEPRGLPSQEAVLIHRDYHLRCIRRLLKSCDVFIFTLGLTETWTHSESGTAFPTAPGTIAGHYDPAVFSFYNMTVANVIADLKEIRSIVIRFNPDMKIVLTVSPVPLTATAAQCHVLSATTFSKSVLRAAAGEFCGEFENCDYFPSYELVATPFSRGALYSRNLRNVEQRAVDIVMKMFYDEHMRSASEVSNDTTARTAGPGKLKNKKVKQSTDVVCEDVLLDAFAP